MRREDPSIFYKFYNPEEFVDRFNFEPEQGIDVIIPIIHTNELWRSNLVSLYREIPVKRLLIGDGGCIDESIEIAKQFPRVVVYDHSSFVSLGYSIRNLIESVETEWFIYLHSDVYLPPGWFDSMKRHQDEYDWFECNQRIAILADYDLNDGFTRPLSGSQMGRKTAFSQILSKVDDDYLYRTEDIAFAAMIEQAGFRYGRANDVCHYHQVMYKPSKWVRKIKSVSINIEPSHEEHVRALTMHLKALVKYLDPTPMRVSWLRTTLRELHSVSDLDKVAFRKWVDKTNPKWSSYLVEPFKERLRHFLKAGYRLIFG